MYWHKTPLLIQWLYPGLVWHLPRNQKNLYITFDDGPVPEITPAVLDILDAFKSKASFFCVGDNVSKHPEVYQKVLEHGHTTANHTFNHLNGWDTDTTEYLANVSQCGELLNHGIEKTKKVLFRPPYGKIKRKAANRLSNQYDIIMWDVLSGDFDHRLSPEDCLANTIRATQPGSVIIFHDSQKAEKNMLYALPRFMDHFAKQGFKFLAL